MRNGAMSSAIFAALEHDPDVNLHESPITISSKGTLRIEGEVPSVTAKRKILRIAIRVSGTESIDDCVRLRPGAARGDHELLQAVITALMHDSSFRDLPIRDGRDAPQNPGIDVSVTDGIIALFGTVGSLSHRRLAEVIAWWTPGCRDVDNRLQVDPPEQETDDEINDVVRLVLEKDPALDAGQIRSQTRNGEITLTGCVHSVEVRRIAAEDCWCIPGVHAVHNRIEVQL